MDVVHIYQWNDGGYQRIHHYTVIFKEIVISKKKDTVGKQKRCWKGGTWIPAVPWMPRGTYSVRLVGFLFTCVCIHKWNLNVTKYFFCFFFGSSIFYIHQQLIDPVFVHFPPNASAIHHQIKDARKSSIKTLDLPTSQYQLCHCHSTRITTPPWR